MTAERDALAELVACKDLHERWGAINPGESGCEKEVLRDEWRKREPAAWAAARAVLAAQPDNDQPGGVASATRKDAGTTHCSPASDSPGVTLSTSPDPTAAPAQGEPVCEHVALSGRLDKSAQGEPPAPDDLVQRLRDVLRNWTNVTDDEQSVIREAADLIEQQEREIARVKLQLTSEITSALAERDALRLANIDAANLPAECSDMSVDIEKYRNEIAELKSERDAAQRAGVTTANYWKDRAELAEDQRERTRDAWATRAERAEAERDGAP